MSRTCDSCGKPLGSTRNRCHDCGGESYRGSRNGDDFAPIDGTAYWFRKLIGRVRGED